CAQRPEPAGAAPAAEVASGSRTDEARAPERPAAVSSAPGRRAPELVGLTRGQVSRLPGAPSLLRRDAPAEVWQYIGATCVLHVFLYQERDVSRVAYYDAGTRSGRNFAARDCYDRLRDERAAGES